MKKILIVLSIIAATSSTMAQSGYYHQVGDTVRGKCPIYHYEQGWWPTLNTAGYSDSLISTVGGTAKGYMKHTTDTPLKVIGIASTVTRLYAQGPTIYEDLDTSIEPAMDYVLFDATATGLEEKARVRWTDDYMTHPRRYMELPIKTGFCEAMEDHNTIVSLREYYFDSAITVTDSFYVGCSFPDVSIYGDDTNALNAFIYAAFHRWDFCAYGAPEDSIYMDCAAVLPVFTYYDSSGIDNSWSYITRKRFQLIFPIIEYDTSCVTPDEPQVAYRDSLKVRMEWIDSNNLSWEVSRTSPGGDPYTGLITPTTAPYIEYTDINDDSVYHVYVRGYCKTGIFSGWSDWSTPCLIDSIPTPPIGIKPVETADFTLSPNPANGIVTLKCYEPIQGSVEIVDMQGKCCFSKAFAGDVMEFDVSTLPAGTYLVCITTEKGTTTKKLSIE